jgi:transcriptional regulator with XRE-family HTH domain
MKHHQPKNITLGQYIRERRQALGLSYQQAGERSGLHHSYWNKLENGHYHQPAPKHLQAIAQTIEVAYEDLFGLAGYDNPRRLPSFRPYLRAKYDLPAEAVADLERYFELLRNYYDIPPDQPVFPPKQPGPSEGEIDETLRGAA